MQSLFSAVISRYAALFIQFLLVILIARHLSKDDAGYYFSIFGLIATGFCLSGFGLPDGIMKLCSELIASNNIGSLSKTVEKVCVFSAVTSVFIASTALTVAVYLGAGIYISILSSIWWFNYAMLFLFSQIIIGIGRVSLGTFLFYTSINIALLTTTIPYIIFSQDISLNGIVLANVIGSGLAMLSSFVVLINCRRGFPANGPAEPILPILVTGAHLAGARIMQASLAWLPVWGATLFIGPAAGGSLGAASRLLVAVTGVIASLRFSVRPEIVKKFYANDWSGIARISNSIALAALIVTLIAIIGNITLGDTILPFVLGDKYVGISLTLSLMLIGAVGEAMGGPVDEVLKMTGKAKIVSFTLIMALLVESVLIYFTSQFGLNAIALSQGGVFCAMYLAQVIYLKRYAGIWISPFIPIFRIISNGWSRGR
ncbi:lipopolysaccharide biosynthesis protein [Caulobacter sp. DWR1-3-2b1]|uniref:lipopolysaccharide biosynthesis protein n=1 Tax=Caulobacter sp. DWR1-3-2b1 TaxID=2804670 RepID=UPI003CF7F3F3